MAWLTFPKGALGGAFAMRLAATFVATVSAANAGVPTRARIPRTASGFRIMMSSLRWAGEYANRWLGDVLVDNKTSLTWLSIHALLGNGHQRSIEYSTVRSVRACSVNVGIGCSDWSDTNSSPHDQIAYVVRESMAVHNEGLRIISHPERCATRRQRRASPHALRA